MGNSSDTEESDVGQVNDGEGDYSDVFSDKHNGTQSSGFISRQNHISLNNTILVNFHIFCEQYYLNYVYLKIEKIAPTSLRIHPLYIKYENSPKLNYLMRCGFVC